MNPFDYITRLPEIMPCLVSLADLPLYLDRTRDDLANREWQITEYRPDVGLLRARVPQCCELVLDDATTGGFSGVPYLWWPIFFDEPVYTTTSKVPQDNHERAYELGFETLSSM